MNCERCHENPATIHVTYIENGKKVDRYLCEQCAQETGQIDFEHPLSFQNFLTGLLDMTMGNNNPHIQPKSSQNGQGVQCPVCGMTYKEFRNTGKLGCMECYKTFEEQMNTILKRIHGNTNHGGKIPQRAASALKVKRQIARLKQQLQEAIEKEEFESAASLRDQIRDLEKGEE